MTKCVYTTIVVVIYNTNKMKSGDIYEIDYVKIKNQPKVRTRIVMFDEREVFVDMITKDDEFLFAKNRTLIYSRISRSYFDKHATYIYSKPFNEKELEKHKPYLPLRLNCFKNTFWTDYNFSSKEELIEYLNIYNKDSEVFEGLNTNKIIVFPSSQQCANKKSVLINSDRYYFTGAELLLKCFSIQKDYVKLNKPYFSIFRLIMDGREEKRLDGVGIYRLGIKGNVPSYYLGGWQSNSEASINKKLII